MTHDWEKTYLKAEQDTTLELEKKELEILKAQLEMARIQTEIKDFDTGEMYKIPKLFR